MGAFSDMLRPMRRTHLIPGILWLLASLSLGGCSLMLDVGETQQELPPAALCDGDCGEGQRCDAGACVLCASNELSCTDGTDDDCDGLIDCADPDCEALRCEDGNLCTLQDTCRAGVCEAGDPVDCNGPAGQCTSPGGVCNPDTGVCVSEPLPAGTACDDGSLCTSGDACNGEGACVGSDPKSCAQIPLCFTATGSGECDAATGECPFVPTPGIDCDDGNPCTVASACNEQGQCVAQANAADGTICGPNPANRCCGGQCKDIANDPQNCGGCGMGCATGICQPVSATAPVCSDAGQPPAGSPEVSGRCTCVGSNAQCPGSQICRTFQPGRNLCSPNTSAGCAPGSFGVEVLNCPNFCAYPAP